MLRRSFVGMAAAPALSAAGEGVEIAIDRQRFLIDGAPAYGGTRAEGLLMNLTWPEALVAEPRVEVLTSWHEQGVRALLVTMRGFTARGDLPDQTLNRLRRALDAASRAGMGVILTIFSRDGDGHYENDAAVRRAVRTTIEFVLTRQFRHVLIELAAECGRLDIDSPLLTPELIPALIREAKEMMYQRRRLLVTVSAARGEAPSDEIVNESDFVMIRAAGIKQASQFSGLARKVRKMTGGRAKPLLFAADIPADRRAFVERCSAAIAEASSWGAVTPLPRTAPLSVLKETMER